MLVRNRLIVTLIGACLLPAVGTCQTPVFSSDTIVDAATYESGVSHRFPYSRIVERGLVYIFGENLASGTAEAPGPQWPTALHGTSVMFGGMPAPLLFVSPNKIVLQCPIIRTLNLDAPVTVTTESGSATAFTSVRSGGAFGIFTMEDGPCGRGQLFNMENGDLVLNDSDHSAEPGQYIVLYGHGLGQTIPETPIGSPAPGDPPLRIWFPQYFTAFLGDEALAVGDVRFQSKAPGLIGVDFMHIQLRPDVPEGCDLPLWIGGAASGGSPPFASQAIPISIHRGGGKCVPATPKAYGMLRWQKTMSNGTTVPPVQEELVVDFYRTALRVAPIAEQLYPPARNIARKSFPIPGPRCPVLDQATERLNVGEMELFPGTQPPLHSQPEPIESRREYRISLPEGTMKAGVYGVEAGGDGSPFPSFASSVEIPEPIRVLTDLKPGMRIPVRPPYLSVPPLELRWEGGDPNSMVMIVTRCGGGLEQKPPFGEAYYAMKASVGEARVGLGSSCDVEIRNYGEAQDAAHFPLDGLSKPGEHGWRYQFVYTDLGFELVR